MTTSGTRAIAPTINIVLGMPCLASALVAPAAAAYGGGGGGGGGGGSGGVAPPPTVRIRPQHEAAVARVLAARRRCREAGTLLTIKYDTIFQYLAVSSKWDRTVVTQGFCSLPMWGRQRGLSSLPVPYDNCRPTTNPTPPQYLRVVAEALRPLGPRAMFYLAAAVSDFYIPWGQLVGGAR